MNGLNTRSLRKWHYRMASEVNTSGISHVLIDIST